MKARNFIFSFLPFWLFVILFKSGAGLHFALLSILGERVMPLWMVGMVVGGATLLETILDVPAGYALDRFGYRKLLLVAMGISVCGAALFFFGLTLVTYLGALACIYFGWLLFNPGINAYLLSQVPRKIAGRSIGFLHATGALGLLISAVLLTVVARWNIFSIALLLTGLLCGAFLAIFFTTPEHTSVHAEKKIRHHHYFVRRTFLHRVVLSVRELNPAGSFLILQSLVGSLFYGVIWFVVPLILTQNGDHRVLGIGLSMFDLAVVLLGAGLGKIAERGKWRRMVFVGLLLFALCGMSIGFNLNGWFLLFGFIASVGDEMSLISLWTWLDHLDATHTKDGLMSGAIVLFADLGWTIAPIAAGFLYEKIGAHWTIMFAALPILCVWILTLLFMKPLTNTLRADGLILPVETPHRARQKR